MVDHYTTTRPVSSTLVKAARIAPLIVILVVLQSCTEDDSFLDSQPPSSYISVCAEPPTGDVLIPLQVGSFWDYDVTRFYSESDSVNEYPWVVEVDDRVMLSGDIEWFLIFEGSPKAPRTAYLGPLYYKNCAEGYCRKTSVTFEYIFLKYPASVGEEYTPTSRSNYIYSLVDSSESVIVLAGEFPCYHYVKVGYEGKYQWDYYVAPGIGIIKEEYRYDGGLSNVRELREYGVRQ